jgi:fructokinase
MDCLPDKNVIGGAPFNVAIHLNRLGEDAGIISKIGEDELGEQIQDFLTREGVGAYVQKDNQYKTGHVTVKFIDGQPDYTIHAGCGWEFLDFKPTQAPDYFMFGSLALHFEQNKSSFLAYKEEFKDSTFICDINLRKPFYSNENIELCLSSADILKINDEELDYLGEKYGVDNPIVWLKDKYNISKIILTKGSQGATAYWDGEEVDCPIEPVANLVDTVGAGDSFTALFIHGLIHGLPLSDNLKRATDFAALICQNSGAVPSDVQIYSNFKL